MGQNIFLLADISGTNARFATTDLDGNQIAMQTYKVREYPTLAGALRHFCNTFCAGSVYVAAALGVAGPVLADVVHFTNSDWVCDKDELSKILCTKQIFILNNFEAIALAIGNLDPQEMTSLQSGVPSSRHAILVIGPGTGLGVAALAPDGDGPMKALTTEAGHVRYAPVNEHERKIVRFLTRTYNLVSAEHLISGPGLLNIYKANCLMTSQECQRVTVPDIVDKARAGDQLALQVIEDFSAMFGSFASQMALSWNALGGIYLTGGVMKGMGPSFQTDRFLERFNTNPRMVDLLGRTPVMRINADIPAHAGLLTLLKQKKL